MGKTKPVILISTYGGHKSGIGHIFRDSELAKSLRSFAKVVFHANGSDEVFELLDERGVSQVLRGNFKEAIQKSCPDLIIYDRPFALGKIRWNSRFKRPRIIALDYFYYNDDSVDVAINIKSHHLNKYKRKQIQNICEGIKYAIIREEILKQKKRKKMNKKVKNILVTFGGADPKNNTQKVIQILNGINTEKFNVSIIRGCFFEKEVKYSLRKGIHNYIVKNRILNVGSLMRRADLAFCGAGTTMMELLSIGCPTVVLAQTREEFELAKRLAEERALLLLESGCSVDTGRKKVQKFILNPCLRGEMIKKGKQLFDGRGKERIKQIILHNLRCRKK